MKINSYAVLFVCAGLCAGTASQTLPTDIYAPPPEILERNDAQVLSDIEQRLRLLDASQGQNQSALQNALDSAYYSQQSRQDQDRTISPATYGSLWAIAREARARFRSEAGSASIMQIVQTIYDANPQAFIGGDMNRLRADRTLTIPDLSLAAAQDTGAAIANISTASVSKGLRTSSQPSPQVPSVAASQSEGGAIRLSLTDPNAAQRDARGNDQVERGGQDSFADFSDVIAQLDAADAQASQSAETQSAAAGQDNQPQQVQTQPAQGQNQSTQPEPQQLITPQAAQTAEQLEIVEESPQGVAVSSSALASFSQTASNETSFFSEYRQLIMILIPLLLGAFGYFYIVHSNARKPALQHNLDRTRLKRGNADSPEPLPDSLTATIARYFNDFMIRISTRLSRTSVVSTRLKSAKTAHGNVKVSASVRSGATSVQAAEPSSSQDNISVQAMAVQEFQHSIDAMAGLCDIGEFGAALTRFEELIGTHPQTAGELAMQQLLARFKAYNSVPALHTKAMATRLDALTATIENYQPDSNVDLSKKQVSTQDKVVTIPTGKTSSGS